MSPLVAALRAPPDAPLPVLLQRLSNLVLRLRLNHPCLHAPVLADSVRRRLLSPLQRHVLATACATRDQPPHHFSYEHHESAAVVHALLESFLPAPPARNALLPLPAVYDALHAALVARDPRSHAFRVLAAVWADLVDLLARQLDLWLAQTLHPELLRGFFIDVSCAPPRVDPHRLPAFVPPRVAGMILFAGTAAKCSHILTADVAQPPEAWQTTPRAAASSSSPAAAPAARSPSAQAGLLCAARVAPLCLSARDAVQRMKERPLGAQLILQAAASQWRATAAAHLSTLLPFSDIASRLRHLRDYLLHANVEFWHLFFERLRDTPLALPSASGVASGDNGGGDEDGEDDAGSHGVLSAARRADAERALNNLLASVAADLHHAVDASASPDAPFSLVVDASAALQPRFALLFHETPVLASRASVYCDLFSLTFALRRAACESGAAASHLRVLHRGMRHGSTRARRDATRRALAQAFETRRRMGVFLDAFEWYVQGEVIEPKFGALRACLARHARDDGAPPQPHLFDEVCALHERALDAIAQQCFLRDRGVHARVHAVLAACVAFADCVRDVGDPVRDAAALARACAQAGTEFERQSALLVQMLLHSQRGLGAESKVHALLLRLNLNAYDPF